MWNLSSLTRDQTPAPCIGSTVLITGLPGKSHLLYHFDRKFKAEYFQRQNFSYEGIAKKTTGMDMEEHNQEYLSNPIKYAFVGIYI